MKVTSSGIQPNWCDQECLFVEAVEEGLRLICCPKGMSSGLHTLLPTAPVLYAVVSNIDILDTKAASADLSFHLPALVPLQMTWLSVKVNAEPKPDSVHVHFKGKWSVHCIKEGNSGALVLAVPVGHRVKFKFHAVHYTYACGTLPSTATYLFHMHFLAFLLVSILELLGYNFYFASGASILHSSGIYLS